MKNKQNITVNIEGLPTTHFCIGVPNGTELCGRPTFSRNLCNTCYYKLLGEQPHRPTCKAPGCVYVARCKGFCMTHYGRYFYTEVRITQSEEDCSAWRPGPSVGGSKRKTRYPREAPPPPPPSPPAGPRPLGLQFRDPAGDIWPTDPGGDTVEVRFTYEQDPVWLLIRTTEPSKTLLADEQYDAEHTTQLLTRADALGISADLVFLLCALL